MMASATNDPTSSLNLGALSISGPYSLSDIVPPEGVQAFDLNDFCSLGVTPIGNTTVQSIQCCVRESSSGFFNRSLLLLLIQPNLPQSWLRIERRLDARPLQGQPEWLAEVSCDLALLSRKKEKLVFAPYEKVTAWPYQRLPRLEGVLDITSLIIEECRLDEASTNDSWTIYTNRWLFHSYFRQLLSDKYEPTTRIPPGADSLRPDLRARMLARFRGPTAITGLLAQPNGVVVPKTFRRSSSASSPDILTPSHNLPRLFGGSTTNAIDLSLAGELILGIANTPQWKEDTMRLRGDHANALCDFIQRYIDQARRHLELKFVTEKALRLLQDVCSSSGELPTSCWLHGVTIRPSSFINRGGEAIIQLGDHNGREVAVRTFFSPSNGWDSPGAQHTLKLIKREIVTHRQLEHPNIIELLGISKQPDNPEVPSIVLPFYLNGAAKGYLMQNPSPINFVRVLCGMTSGLNYFHTRSPPIIHGDLHPGNVLVNDEGKAVLCDFGFSHIKHDVTRSLTVSQTTQNYIYLAPEIGHLVVGGAQPYPYGLESARPTQEADMYALGLTFYELGASEPPFADAPSPFKALQWAIAGQRPSMPESLGGLQRDDVAQVWDRMVKMWLADPQERIAAKTLDSYLSKLWNRVSNST